MYMSAANLGLLLYRDRFSPSTMLIYSLILSEKDGTFDVGNITTLPVTTEELCSSPDVVQYFWSYGCHLTYTTQAFQQETEENKCM